MAFNVGDLVQLKSGGPKMTVEKLEGSEVSCVWFDGTNPKYGIFPVNTLKIYESPQGKSSSYSPPSQWS
jgi:uncharacterized protein YodC (DUF2158 family)